MRRVMYGLVAWRLAVASVLAALLLPPFSFRRLRAMLFKAGGCQIAAGVEVAGGCTVTHPNLTAGKGVYVGPRCLIVPTREAAVALAPMVSLGPDVKLLTVTHELGDERRRAGVFRSAPITVGAGAWVGASATILAGVTIGPGAVVAAGAVVTEDVADNTMVGGIPAKPIRSLAV